MRRPEPPGHRRPPPASHDGSRGDRLRDLSEHADAAPRRRDDVAQVACGDTMVVYSPAARATYCLGPLTAAIWHCLDGSLTLGELAEDLAAALEIDLPEVWTHLPAIVRRLGRRGLLAGVGPQGGPDRPGRRADDGLTPVRAPG